MMNLPDGRLSFPRQDKMVENLGFDTTEFIISPPDRLEPYSFSYCFRVVNKVVVEAITRVSMNWNWAAPLSVTRNVDFDSKKNDDFHWNEVFHSCFQRVTNAT